MSTNQIITISYKEVNNSSLSGLEINLIESAKQIANSAYSPYSKFNVGAAVLLNNDKIITGNNQENSSFPCGICAERTALFFAKSKYPTSLIKKIVITANSIKFKMLNPVGPCGLCRQVLLEYEENQNQNIEIILYNPNKIIKIARAKDLLPFFFKENRLKN